MPRPPRYEEAGATYHVTIHAVDGGTIVRTDLDRTALLRAFAATVTRYRWICLACSILDTHYHLLVTTPEANLARGMQYLNGTYAQQFNRTHGRRGHLFRERYRPKRVRTDAHLQQSVRYIALNAFEANVASHPRRDRWSSYPGVVGARRNWPFIARREVLGYFGTGDSALRQIVEFVESELAPRTKSA